MIYDCGSLCESFITFDCVLDGFSVKLILTIVTM